MNDYLYRLGDNLYLNVTNRCNNSCTFCIKHKTRLFENRFNLWLNKEPVANDILTKITNPLQYKQIVFCGYGEPLIRLELVKEIAKALKEKQATIRIDTDGQANLFHGRNILGDLSGIVDEINISLNAHDNKTYQKLCRPVFGDKAFEAVKAFAKEAKKHIPTVVLTSVELPGVDINGCTEIAQDIGADFKTRPYYEKEYLPAQ